MHLTTTTILSLLLPTLALSATTTTSTPSSTIISHFAARYSLTSIPIYTSTSYAASVISLNAVATTYQINCLPSAPTSDCSLASPLTLIAGPNTFSFAEPFTATVEVAGVTVIEKGTEDLACSFTHSSESATCTVKLTVTASGAGKTTTTSLSTKAGIPTESVGYQTLTVTGGLESFTAPAATETPNVGVAGRAMVTGVPLGAAVVAVAVLL